MNERSTEEVLRDHLALAQLGDIETDIARNMAPDCVLMTSYGVFRGHEGVRDAAKLLDDQIGRNAVRLSNPVVVTRVSIPRMVCPNRAGVD